MNLTNFKIQELKPIIYDRVVRGKTWTEIAKKYNVGERKLSQMFSKVGSCRFWGGIK